MRTKSGFTLIELLIVVAIIAILAAIAVPNFLEAQTRSKVSRSKADMRTYATALGAYHVDNNGYPTNNSVGSASFFRPLTKLSTPVAYLTDGLLEDPFGNVDDSFVSSGGKSFYFYLPFTDDDPVVNIGITLNLVPRLAEAEDLGWILVGSGPDRVMSFYLCQNAGGSTTSCLVELADDILDGGSLYDPTNGTISYGDIRRTAKGIQTGAEAP